AQVIDDYEAEDVLGFHDLTVLFRLQVQDHEVRSFARARLAVGASRDVGHAARFVRGDADDPLVRHGDRIDLRRPRGGVENHRVAARIVLIRLALAGIALLRAEVDLAAGADVVAGVDFGLRAETLDVLADGLV